MYFYQNRVKSQITKENFWTLKFIWNCKRFRVARMTLRENKGRKRENKVSREKHPSQISFSKRKDVGADGLLLEQHDMASLTHKTS